MAVVLCDAINLAFDGSGAGKKPAEVDPYLVHNLAVCVRIAFRYDMGVKIDWRDHGGFPIPEFFVMTAHNMGLD